MILLNLLQNEYISFALIVLGAFIGAKIALFLLKSYVKRITDKTKSGLDDKILEVSIKPLYIFVILSGAYFSIDKLTILASYQMWVGRVFFILFVLLAAFWLSKVLGILIDHWLKVKKRFEKTPRLLSKIITITIYLISLLMILSHLNIEITPLVATLGLGGLAIGLALQNTLTNFFAGLHIISDKPLQVGDFIEIEGGNSGYVEDIGWRSTRIRTLSNNNVIIPNAKLAESVIINNSLPDQEVGFVVQCGVSYDSDLEKVEKVTVDVAKKIQEKIPGAVKGFEPVIRYHSFGDSNINFAITLRVETFVDKYLVQHEFIKALKKRYDGEKIEISWPVRVVYNKK